MRKPLSAKPLRDLAFWLYRQLENEYDRLTSDAAVDEALHQRIHLHRSRSARRLT